MRPPWEWLQSIVAMSADIKHRQHYKRDSYRHKVPAYGKTFIAKMMGISVKIPTNY